jgi:hypothetical protein
LTQQCLAACLVSFGNFVSSVYTVSNCSADYGLVGWCARGPAPTAGSSCTAVAVPLPLLLLLPRQERMSGQLCLNMRSRQWPCWLSDAPAVLHPQQAVAALPLLLLLPLQERMSGQRCHNMRSMQWPC